MTWEKSLKAWYLTVFTGTVLSQIFWFPLLSFTKPDFTLEFEALLYYLPITLITSIIMSLPSLIILKKLSEKFKKFEKSKYRMSMGITQILCGVLTFSFTVSYMGLSTIAFAVAFIGTGIFYWDREIKKTDHNNSYNSLLKAN